MFIQIQVTKNGGVIIKKKHYNIILKVSFKLYIILLANISRNSSS